MPLVKIIASALTIGTGGSGGREGPIAQIGAGLRLAAGRAAAFPAGRSGASCWPPAWAPASPAIFRAPLAGALFAAEVLYSLARLRAEVILPAGLASVVAYCTFGAFFGWRPLFLTPPLEFDNPWQLAPYLGLALFVAFLAMLYTRHLSRPDPSVPPLEAAAVAQAGRRGRPERGVGVVLYYALGSNQQVLSVLSFGYGILQAWPGRADDDRRHSCCLLVRAGQDPDHQPDDRQRRLGRRVRPVDGDRRLRRRAPLGVLLHAYWPGLVPQPASFVIVGMAGFFAAAAKTPFSTLVIVSEMTGNYKLILPALWVCTIAFLLSDEQSLYCSQVDRPLAFAGAPGQLRPRSAGGAAGAANSSNRRHHCRCFGPATRLQPSSSGWRARHTR